MARGVRQKCPTAVVRATVPLSDAPPSGNVGVRRTLRVHTLHGSLYTKDATRKPDRLSARLVHPSCRGTQNLHPYVLYVHVCTVRTVPLQQTPHTQRPSSGRMKTIFYRTPSSMASEIGGGVWLAMPGAAARQVRLVGNPRPDKVHTLRNVDSDPPRSNSGPTRPVDRQSTRLSPR